MSRLQQRTGVTVIELLVALAAISLAGVLGTRLLQGHLRQLGRMARIQSQAMLADRFRSELERQWDARCAGPFHPGEWLRIEGEADSARLEVSKIWIRVHAPEGRIAAAVLNRDGDGWQWSFHDPGDGSESREPVPLGFRGRIRLRCPASSYSGGEAPGRIDLELLDEAGRRLDAFAIVGHWGMNQDAAEQ